MNKAKALVIAEAISTISWFAMDSAWMMKYASVALSVSIPLTISTVACVFLVEQTIASVLAACAVSMWAAMNTLWMMDDLVSRPNDLILAQACGLFGAFFFAIAFIADSNKALNLFRRVRFWRKNVSPSSKT